MKGKSVAAWSVSRKMLLTVLAAAMTAAEREPVLDRPAGTEHHTSAVESGSWVKPLGLPEGHNGGTLERLAAPAGPTRPHIMLILFECADVFVLSLLRLRDS